MRLFGYLLLAAAPFLAACPKEKPPAPEPPPNYEAIRDSSEGSQQRLKKETRKY